MFLPLFRLVPAVVLTLKTSEVSAILVFSTKTTQSRPQEGYTKFFQIWSSVTDYGELCE